MNMERRPIKTRGALWAQKIAQLLASKDITPNHISLMSVLFALLACLFYALASVLPFAIILVPLAIQARLLCNLFDGMVAVEHGKKSKSGDVFNDAPDRFADLLIICGSGFYIASYPIAWHLAWFAGAMALLTAYVRVLGATLTGTHHFFGPMAKQHRMFLLTVAALIDFVNSLLFSNSLSMGAATYLAILLMGLASLYTAWRRLVRIVRDLENRH